MDIERFADRTEAGRLLALKLEKYKDQSVVVYAMPRGGVVTGVEIAGYLNSSLDLVIARKIGHPTNPEYAIGAISENGEQVFSKDAESVDKMWLKKEIEEKLKEAKQRRGKYLPRKIQISARGRIAILVDDGVATGLSLRAAIKELRQQNPAKLIAAVPVVSKSIAGIIEKEADELVSLIVPSDDEFLGAVGSYYDDFYQVEDREVISILLQYGHG